MSRRLLRFATTGGLSVGVDIALLAALHSGLSVPLPVAATAGYFASLVVNYSLNHAWVFEASGQHGRRMLRYGSLVVLNYALTLVGLTGLVALGLWYLVAKAIVVVVCAVLNFALFRSWVFASD